jgi:hypothetical protein
MRCFQMKELLTASGGFRDDNAEKMGDDIALLAKQVAADPFFICYHPDDLEGGSHPDESAIIQTKNMQLHMDAADLPVVKYSDIERILDSLERYFAKPKKEKIEHGQIVQEAVEAGPGESETFTGSLTLVIPVHQAQELTHLRLGWGMWSYAWKFSTTAYPMEGEKLIIPTGHPDFKKQQISLAFLYQPLDEIRDYFGKSSFSMIYNYATRDLVIYTGNIVLYMPYLTGRGVNIYWERRSRGGDRIVFQLARNLHSRTDGSKCLWHDGNGDTVYSTTGTRNTRGRCKSFDALLFRLPLCMVNSIPLYVETSRARARFFVGDRGF